LTPKVGGQGGIYITYKFFFSLAFNVWFSYFQHQKLKVVLKKKQNEEETLNLFIFTPNSNFQHQKLEVKKGKRQQIKF
jgi:hypothetical protein